MANSQARHCGDIRGLGDETCLLQAALRQRFDDCRPADGQRPAADGAALQQVSGHHQAPQQQQRWSPAAEFAHTPHTHLHRGLAHSRQLRHTHIRFSRIRCFCPPSPQGGARGRRHSGRTSEASSTIPRSAGLCRRRSLSGTRVLASMDVHALQYTVTRSAAEGRNHSLTLCRTRCAGLRGSSR